MLLPHHDPRVAYLHFLRSNTVRATVVPELGQHIECDTRIVDKDGVAHIAMRPVGFDNFQTFSLAKVIWISLPFGYSKPKLGIFCGPRARSELRKSGFAPKLKRRTAKTVVMKLGATQLVLTFANREDFITVVMAVHAVRWPNVTAPLRRGTVLWMLARHLVLSRR